ncbi:sal-like protein 3 [Sinocyclocheilus anshuiensis]|uniref:sal-like protein 3 n=1 Tax=Sinocyclocheilus anshuiensis TaxID=1608454 RepID=UPI0007BA64DD|nr:PREDICTED: sal-like protein 3 [Sinocyclocheilus anshuiensis]
MSRRKQAKPQHLRSDEEGTQSDKSPDNALLLRGGDEEDSGTESRSGGEETHVCERCCAEFFKWSEMLEHQQKCTDDPPVLIVKENEEKAISRGSPTESLLSAHSDSAEMEVSELNSELAEKVDEMPEETHIIDLNEQMDISLPEHKTSNLSPLPLDNENTTSSPAPPITNHYDMPSTNVTLEILHSTRVAVAQFSQSIHCAGSAGKLNSAAIPMILEQLMALQQQQVQQLQLIEQIRSQVAVMNRQPTQAALNPASKSLPSDSNTYNFQGIAPPPVLPLSGVMPSAVNGQASVSQASMLARPPLLSSQPSSGQISSRALESATASVTSSSPHLFSYSGASPLLPTCSGSHSSVSNTQSISTPSPLSAGQSSLLSPSANLPLLPQSPPNGVIFPNPLASIAATASALDPLAAMMKYRKGKLPSVSMFDSKPSSEDPFFKHKCRFCAKVFGSDSALQIHLRSHTGERPFKCNICGNRFSTKGNLKVHFQRHKEKYPHVQMNPYPVPEYLDNIPTSSGIPYGMSFPPEKAGPTWLDSKPVLPTVPSSVGLQLPPTVPVIESLSDSFTSTPSERSPHRPSPARGELAPSSPNPTGTETDMSTIATSPKSNREGEITHSFNTEEVHLPSNSMTRNANNPNILLPQSTSTEKPVKVNVTESTDAPSADNKSSSPPLISDQFKAKFPFGGLQDSMQTSETSKLQQFVENIDKKMMEPNQCVICHRVLSCQSALKMHYRIHTGERPFKCKVCGRAFTTKGNLKTHFGVHRAKPPLRIQHSCPICQKKFTNAVVLQQHIRMHMGGQIPNTPLAETIYERDTDMESFDSMSTYDDDCLDDISFEEEGDVVENNENTLSSFSDSPPPISSLPTSVSETQSVGEDSSVNLSQSNGKMMVRCGPMDNDLHGLGSTTTGEMENHSIKTSLMPHSSSSIHISPYPSSQPEGQHEHLVSLNLSFKVPEATSIVKSETTDCPAANTVNEVTVNQTGIQPITSTFKKENSFNMQFFNKEHENAQRSTEQDTKNLPTAVKLEMNACNRPYILKEGPFPAFGLQFPNSRSEVMIPAVTSLTGPPPARRTPKQHNCRACGKNFSSASALQIHERTHTGEKPFGCSVCGRAFTTKGNLKVHMGTHMWNNTPARRGRRLSVENPIALLGGDALKFSEAFQKDLAARAMNVDQNFWSRYAAAITNGLAMRNNEISVIQSGGVPQLPAITVATDKASTGNSPPITAMEKTGLERGAGQHFSMMIDDKKDIGIN